MKMRVATIEDLSDVVALTTAAYQPYTELFGYPPIPVTEDYAPRIARGEIFLRQIDGAVVALAVIEHHADHLMLFSIAVSPAFQRAGHGIAVLNWVEGMAREWAVPEMRLYTNARMERNISLYSAFGFRETGRRSNPNRPGWTIVDMAKDMTAI